MNPTVPGSDLESIPCMGNSFTKNEQSLVGDLHDARIVAQGPRDQEICVCRVSCGKARCFVFFLVLAHIHPGACCLCHSVVRIDPVTISPRCVIDLVTISPGCVVDLVAISRRVND